MRERIHHHPAGLVPAITLALALALQAAALPAAAATLNLAWVQPERYTDAGRDPGDRDRHLATLAGHFEQLARRLPDGQSLAIDVLDVDLAGEVEPTRGRDLRIVRDRADWPRMSLRYTLSDGGTTLSTGVARLSELGYMNSTIAATRRNESLVHEKRMVDRWFDETFLRR